MITDKGHLGYDTSIIKQEFEYSHQKVDKILWHPIYAAPEDVPSKFKEWRVMRDFTLRQVEKQTGISNCYLSQLETGKVNKPSFDVVVKLLRLYLVELTIK